MTQCVCMYTVFFQWQLKKTFFQMSQIRKFLWYFEKVHVYVDPNSANHVQESIVRSVRQANITTWSNGSVRPGTVCHHGDLRTPAHLALLQFPDGPSASDMGHGPHMPSRQQAHRAPI